MFRRVVPAASVALRALLLLVFAQAVAIFVHEGIHLQQAWVDGQRDELVISFSPIRSDCGAFACATGSVRYEPDLFWWGEGWPRFVERIVFFEIVLGLARWALEPWRSPSPKTSKDVKANARGIAAEA